MAYDDSKDFAARKRQAGKAGITVQEAAAEQAMLKMMAAGADDTTAQIEQKLAGHEAYLEAVFDSSQPIAETLEHIEQLQLEVRYLRLLLEDASLLARFVEGDERLPGILRARVPFTSSADAGELLQPPDASGPPPRPRSGYDPGRTS